MFSELCSRSITCYMPNASKLPSSSSGLDSPVPALDSFHPRHSLPSFQKFPTFAELLSENETSSRDTESKQSLFVQLLGAEVSRLYEDVRRLPEKYDPRLESVLEHALDRGLTYEQLTDEGRTLLDQGAMAFFSSDPPAKKPVEKKLEQERALREEPPPRGPEIGIDVPVESIRPFFWV